MPYPVNRVILNNDGRQQINNLTFPSDIGGHGVLMIFKEYKYATTRSLLSSRSPTITVGDSILLPLPQKLQENTTVNLNRFEQGITGQAVSTAASAASASGNGSILTAIQDAVKGILPNGSDAYNMITQDGGSGFTKNLQENANFLLRKSLEQVGQARNFDAGFGSTMNPKAALAFEGVPFRQPVFDWNLAPRSAEESVRLKNILNTFRRNALPAYQGISGGGELLERAMFRYPSTVDIYLLGVDPEYYLFFKTCMIQSVAVDYTPNGVSVLKGGRPAMMNLSVQFMEMDIHTSEDYGGTGGGTIASGLTEGER